MHINETNILKPNKYSVGLVWAPPPLTIDRSVYICRVTKCIYAKKQTNPELNVKPLVEEVTRSNLSVQSIISEKLLINCMSSAVISIKVNMLSYAVLL